jgi:anti-sigma factor RsiW
MRCERFRMLMERYMDKTLPPRPSERAAVHAARCPACRASLEDALRIRALLASAPEPSPPADLGARIMERVMLEWDRYPADVRGARSARGRPNGYRRLGLSLVVAAAVLGVSLLIPGIAYTEVLAPALGHSRNPWGIEQPRTVKVMIDSADLTVGRMVLGHDETRTGRR